MTPEALARLHARAFTYPRPWSAAEFAAVLQGPGVVLLTQPLPEGASPRGEEDPSPRPGRPPTPSLPHEGGGRRPDSAGFLLGRILAGEAEVLTLAVHPDARRRGIGRDLLARFLARAAAGGAARAFLEVAEDNPGALALYAAAGFAAVGRRRGYAAPGVDALVMARDLTGI